MPNIEKPTDPQFQIPTDKVLDLHKNIKTWTWVRNPRAKNLTIHMDTRHPEYVYVQDRDGCWMTWDMLMYQIQPQFPIPVFSYDS